MPFRFTLAPLLRLRQSIERQRALRLREASLKVAQVQESLLQLDRFLSGSAEADHARLREQRPAVELHFAALSRENLLRFRGNLETEVRRLEVERQQAAAEYHHAYREREVLETLREKQRRAWQEEDLRRQQRALDEAHLLRFWRRQEG